MSLPSPSVSDGRVVIPSVIVDDGLTKDAVQACLKTIAAHIKRSGR